jgi:hypothetical protein
MWLVVLRHKNLVIALPARPSSKRLKVGRTYRCSRHRMQFWNKMMYISEGRRASFQHYSKNTIRPSLLSDKLSHASTALSIGQRHKTMISSNTWFFAITFDYDILFLQHGFPEVPCCISWFWDTQPIPPTVDDIFPSFQWTKFTCQLVQLECFGLIGWNTLKEYWCLFLLASIFPLSKGSGLSRR